MKKLMILATCGLAASGVFAQGIEATTPSAKDVAKQDAVNEMLLDDDGVCIVTAPDGSYQIFTRGTGVYQFVNPKAELAARKVARLQAEKNLVKFISTKIDAEDGVEQVQKNCLVMSGDGKVQEEHPSMEDMETLNGKIKSGAKGMINGLVVVESKKVPTEGGTGGMIQVTMVYSSKTAKASAWAGKKFQDHQADLEINEAKNKARVNAARRAAENTAQEGGAAVTGSVSGQDCSVSGGTSSSATMPVNKPEHRRNKTEY